MPSIFSTWIAFFFYAGVSLDDKLLSIEKIFDKKVIWIEEVLDDKKS